MVYEYFDHLEESPKDLMTDEIYICISNSAKEYYASEMLILGKCSFSWEELGKTFPPSKKSIQTAGIRQMKLIFNRNDTPRDRHYSGCTDSSVAEEQSNPVRQEPTHLLAMLSQRKRS